MSFSRRAILLGLAALIPAGLASAAHAETKVIEAGKIFPYLDLFLGLAPAERSHFTMAYTLRKDGKPPAGVSIILLVNGGRIPLTVAPDGRVTRLPTLAELKAKAGVELNKPDGSKINVIMDLLARVAPSTTVQAGDLAAAVNQCAGVIKAKAGLLGFAAPKIKRVVMRGSGPGTGFNAQGVGKPLPMVNGAAIYDPELMPGIVTIKLANAPSAFLLDGRPK